MLKARGKLISLLTACMSLVLMLVMGITTLSIQPKVASAADTKIEFTLGANGAASHNDGTSKTSYTETVDGYTLTLSNVSNFYTGALDAKGNSCIKLGASSKTGGFSFTVPDDVTKAIIAVAGYKAKTVTVKINGTSTAISTKSDNGAYTDITVDTSSTKTVELVTASGYRAMVNTITYVIPAAEGACEHTNADITTVDATCTTDGSKTTDCKDCDYVKTETIPAKGHTYNNGEIKKAASCTETGTKLFVCEVCGAEKEETISATGHNYVDGCCSVCGEDAPLDRTLVFDDVTKRTEYSSDRQVWTENGVTLTNNKESSTNDVGNYVNPARFYSGSNIIVECDGNIAKIVFNCNNASYATALKNSIGETATVNDKVVTVELDGSANEYTVAKLTAQVRMDSLTVTLVKKADAGCAHENVTTTTVDATCTTDGSKTVMCVDCGGQVGETVVLPALGHNYIDNVCENCEKVDPASIVYDRYYYLSINGKYAGEKDGNYYKLFDNEPATLDLNYVFYFVKNGETYDMYNVKAGLIEEGVTLETQEDYTVYIKNGEGKILSHNTTYTTYQRLGFYASTNSYPRNITLTPVELANIGTASVTIGADIILNYYVTMSEDFAEARMFFTVGEKTIDVKGEKVGERYKFSLPIPPQYMVDNVKAELKLDDAVLAVKENFTVKAYATEVMEQAGASNELKQLIIDMLYYGAAAQNYTNHNTDNLANAGVEGASAATPTGTDFTLVTNEAVDSYPAYFKGAGVRFDGENSIYVKLSTTENVTLIVNSTEVAVTGTTVYTDGIKATEFGTTYTFELYCDGVLMQTLTYSVNAYAEAKKESATMGELALALYRYGQSAVAYKNSLTEE